MLPEKVAANEEIRRAQIEIGASADAPLPFLCECDDVACREIVRLRPDEYSATRKDAKQCIVAVDHPFSGRVVRTGDGYVIVEE